ncbi:MAG: tRNA-dihydrouridine synthase family protein [Clostridia bacterium]|nr:tRNA-dihydrouridine synthase family protein [Clostridia bacterium]
MNLYYAPLEGISLRVLRRVHSEVFGCADAYFAPFISPGDQERVNRKGMRDIAPEENREVKPKIQVLTGCAESFLRFLENAKALGYDEININMGCPVQMVTKKGRGSGILREPDALDNFLSEIFSVSDMKISIKTRIGFYSADEFPRLIEIFNKYPISELTVHPRIREQFYKGEPDMEAFSYAYNNYKGRLCYNGDIWEKEDYDAIADKYPNLSGVMIGRGAVKNPAIFREIRGGAKLTTEELYTFTEKMAKEWYEVLKSETYTLYKLKELWGYMSLNFPDEKKITKAIKKASTPDELTGLTKMLPDIKKG